MPGDSKEEAIARTKIIMTPDPARYRGLHGTAILSRYAVTDVRLIPFAFQPHDWYADEKKRTSQIEKAEGKLSVLAFKEQLLRQVRRGGRMILMADLVDDDLPSGRVTVVATHLEDLATPRKRRMQMEELLDRIRGIDHPVILAGDMNTSTHEGLPIGLKRLLRQRFGSGKWWAKEAATEAIKYATPAGWFYDVSHTLIGFARKIDDPTERSIPLFGENREAKFFHVLEDFRFDDGGAFDFRGDSSHAWEGRSGKLANSNERGIKGFVPTEELDRTYGPIGWYKLDWIFVKPPALTSASARRQPYRFAPHLGRTMRRLNHSIPGRISDHNAITVTLPLQEPAPDRDTRNTGYKTAFH
ncbi:MAG: endonuclease/exonuclease/phosphatase family protein [Bryobacterales bacterium]|nr:endonuclease/exonuclease/phosphatase family protein [Bryobacterales bacterium]